MTRSFSFILAMLMHLCISSDSYAQKLPESFPDSLNKFEDEELVSILADLSWKLREKDSDNAILYAMKGIEIAEAEEYTDQLARLYNFLGVIYQHYKHQTQTAIPYYYKGLKIGLENKDSIEIGYVYNNLGDAFYRIGNKPLANQYAEKSMETFMRLGDLRGIAYSCINLGEIKRKIGEYDTAIYYFRKAIDTRIAMEDHLGIASGILEIGWTYNDMEMCDSAMHYFRHSLDLHKQLSNKNYVAYSQIGIGQCFLNSHQYDSALFYYQQAYRLMQERKNYSGIISCQLGIGQIHFRQGRKKEATQVYDTVLLYAKNHGTYDEILQVYHNRADFFHQAGYYEKANENHNEYIHVFDSLFSAMQQQTLNEVENRFTITEDLNRVHESLRERKQRLLYSIAIIGLLLLLILVLYLRQRTKDKLTTELQESIQLKNKIFNIISHDLISPFNVLLGYSQVLKERLMEKDYEQAESFTDIIHNTANDTCELTKNLLNWAQAQRNKIILHQENIAITALTLEAKTTLAPVARKKGITIYVDCDFSGDVFADKDLIRTTLNNLVSNAIKFSIPHNSILIGCEPKGKYIEVFVQDHGVGMSQEQLSKLFKDSETVSTPGTNNEKGTGLGLLVCKEFVELNGGEIFVESQENRGSRFAFTIPVAR